MAKIILAGRVGSTNMKKINGKDGEISCLEVNIADVNPPKDTDPWYRFSIFSSFAEKMQQYILKGTSIQVIGDLKCTPYTKKDGTLGVDKTIINPELTLTGSKQDSQQAAAPAAQAQPQQAAAPAQPQQAPADDGFMNIPDGIDEELPFN